MIQSVIKFLFFCACWELFYMVKNVHKSASKPIVLCYRPTCVSVLFFKIMKVFNILL